MPPTSAAAKPPGGFGAPFFALVAGALAMGLSPIFVRLADVGPFASAFWRVALALPLLWAWLKLSEKDAPAGSGIGLADLLAGLAFTGDLFFWHLSIVTTSVANATFFATTAPIWVVAFGWLLLGERAAPRTLIGIALCVAGGLALLAQSFHLRPAGAIGDLYGAATGLFFGLYFLAVKAARRVHSAARVTFIATVVTAALLFVVALTLEPTILPHTAGGVAALCAMEQAINIIGLVQSDAKQARFIGLPVFPGFDAVAESFDSILITDQNNSRATCEAAVARFGAERVLVPELLRVRIRQQGGAAE